MGLKDWFKKKDDFDPLKDLELSKLRVGFMVDYDLETWQVTGTCRHDYGEGDITDEWEITSGRMKRYLERSEDDEITWTLSKKIPIGAIDDDIRNYIIAHDDPPDKIVYNAKTYYLEESGTGRMLKQDATPKEFVYWEFIDEDDENFVTIEQWGETEFEAAAGHYVEEYQFTNILPGNIE